MPAAAPIQSEPRSVPGCPSDDALLSFIPGLLNEEDASVVSAHVQGCSTCQSRVTTLRKRLSSVGGEAPDPAATIASDQGGLPRPTAKVPSTNHSDPTAATVAYVPKRRQIPKQLGPYQVLGPIGRGGMGLVFKGYHPRLQRYVAIKLLPGLHLADNTAIIRLQREQAAAGRVEHENIVYAFDAGEQDGVDFLIMEYVEGMDLGRLLTTTGPLPVADACEIARQAALGLAHIESCGLVHRDIKPSNLMLSAHGVVKILDLGLAKLREGPIDEAEATHSGFLLGTADYIAPEQIDTPREVDVRSDLYSLGCTLFKLLAGRAPFSDEEHSSVSHKIDAHRREPPPALRTLRPEIPANLDALIAGLLAKDPRARPQHPAEVANALAGLTGGAELRRLAAHSMASVAVESTSDPREYEPSVSNGSTHSQGRTPTPQALLLPQPAASSPRILTMAIAAILAVVVAAGVWAWSAGVLGDASPVGSSTDEPVSFTQSIGASPVSFDLSQPTPERIWPGYRKSSFQPLYESGMLEVRSDSFRLLELGNYEGTPGTFEATIRQVPWHGWAGLYFGYRDTSKGLKPKVGTFQLFSLTAVEQFDKQFNVIGKELGLRRHRGIIDVDPTQFWEESPVAEPIAGHDGNEMRLKIEFGRDTCLGVYVNGQKLSRLSSQTANAGFGKADYRGPFGLYHEGGSHNQAPTWFGEIVFTPAESSP